MAQRTLNRARRRVSDGSRQQLAAAISARDAAKRQRDKTAAALERAQCLVEHTERRLADFGDLDATVTDARAAIVKGGGVLTAELPPKLAGQIADRDKAKTEYASAKDLEAALTREVEQLERTLVDRGGEVKWLAAQVLAEEAERISGDLLIAKRTVWGLENQLSAVAALWLPQNLQSRTATDLAQGARQPYCGATVTVGGILMRSLAVRGCFPPPPSRPMPRCV
jgi:hypothetical protein